MNRAITTTIFSICLVAIFMSLMIGVQSCGGKEKANTDSLGDRAEELVDEYTEDEFFEEGDEDSSEDTAGYQDSDDDNDSYTTPTSSSSSSSSSQNTSTSYSSGSSVSGYLVVAGNYLLEDNADEMVSKLRKQGYRDAEKVVFDLSQYYTVIAGKYSARSSASQIASELKRKGIDNYVVSKK